MLEREMKIHRDAFTDEDGVTTPEVTIVVRAIYTPEQAMTWSDPGSPEEFDIVSSVREGTTEHVELESDEIQKAYDEMSKPTAVYVEEYDTDDGIF